MPFQLRYELILPRGSLVVEDVGRWFAGLDGRPVRAHGIVRILNAAAGDGDQQHDRLGAAARNEIIARIESLGDAARRTNRPFAVVVASIAGLSAIEDMHGSEASDELVAMILSRLRQRFRRTDRAVRYASNRVAIVLARCLPDDLERAAHRFSQAVDSEGYSTTAGQFHVRLHCGGVTGDAHLNDARQLLRRAEEAHDIARKQGIAFLRHEPNTKREIRRRDENAFADEVVHALNDDRILLAFQPIVTTAGRTVAFEEALVRMRRTDGRIASAGSVVPTFERLGQISLIDHRVLEIALRHLREDPARSLSVNVTNSTLRSGPWMDLLSATLAQCPGIGPRLIVELTESQAIEDVDGTRRAFSTIKSLGARTAIDDFGAGYTSFKHLRGLDVDILKIDGAFVQNVGRSADDSFFVRTLADLANHLEIETVAEWVQDEHCAIQLAQWGVTYLQGDYVGRATLGLDPARKPDDRARVA